MQASREFQSRAQAAQRAYLEQSQGAREAVTALISQRSWREGQLLCWQHRPDVDALSAHLAWMGRTAVRRRLLPVLMLWDFTHSQVSSGCARPAVADDVPMDVFAARQAGGPARRRLLSVLAMWPVAGGVIS